MRFCVTCFAMHTSLFSTTVVTRNSGGIACRVRGLGRLPSLDTARGDLCAVVRLYRRVCRENFRFLPTSVCGSRTDGFGLISKGVLPPLGTFTNIKATTTRDVVTTERGKRFVSHRSLGGHTGLGGDIVRALTRGNYLSKLPRADRVSLFRVWVGAPYVTENF